MNKIFGLNTKVENRPLKDWSKKELIAEIKAMNKEDSKGIFKPDAEARKCVEDELARRK
jgi:hypothetical protein